MHWSDLVKHGEDPRRLNSLITWREVDFFDERERAALHLTERLTRLQDEHLSDAEFDALGAHFSDKEIVALVFSIACINAWNRMGVSMRPPLPKLTVNK
jgi:alkylhydroperoxidase family enzyme